MTEWQVKKVGEIADTQLGKMLNKGKQTGRHLKPYLRTDNVHWGRFDLSEIKEMDILPEDQDKYLATKGDLLMCEGGASGRTAIWNEDYDISFQNHVHRIRPKDLKEISPKYLLYYFEWFIKNGFASDLIKGVTISSLSQSGLRSIEVTYPTIDEQHKIVELLEDHLSRLDAALADVKQAKIKAAQFRRSLLQFAFRRRLTDQQEKSNWTTAQLSDLADIGWGDLQVTKKSYVDSGYVAYSATGADGFLPYFDYDSEGIVVSAIGANCGRIFKASGKWSCIKNTMRILPKNSSILLDYLFHYLSDSTIFPKRGSGQPFIGQQDAREIEISFPSVAEQQKIIESVEYSLSRLDASMNLAEQMENQSVGLRRSLLQAAFTGQLTNEVVSV
jgi:restriction endonuclease S subunit